MASTSHVYFFASFQGINCTFEFSLFSLLSFVSRLFTRNNDTLPSPTSRSMPGNHVYKQSPGTSTQSIIPSIYSLEITILLHLICRQQFRAYTQREARTLLGSSTILHHVCTHRQGERLEPNREVIRRGVWTTQSEGWIDGSVLSNQEQMGVEACEPVFARNVGGGEGVGQAEGWWIRSRIPKEDRVF